MSQPWKIGLIGAGGISEAHLAAIKEEPRAQALAISEVNEETARMRADRHGIPHVYTDYREMLKRDDLDAVILCIPNFLHASVAIEALASGKHVLCEKPMALNADQAMTMVDAAKRAGKVLMVGQNNRFRGESMLLKRLVDQGKLGPVYHVKTGWIRRNGIPGWGSWFTSMEKAGGGPLIDIGVHVLDLALWLIGYPRPVTVFGQTYSIFGPKKKGLFGWGTVDDQGVFDVEDLAVAMIKFENGTTLILDVSWAAHIEKDRAYVQMYGEEGGVTMDFDTGKITLFHEEAGVPVDSVLYPGRQNERLLLFQNFLDAAEGKAEPICRPEQGVYIHRILDAIYTSSRTGKPVTLDETD
jgi:predicted dehydrogenase